MTKLISGRVSKVPSANVSVDRYEFIELSETEPDLGLPAGSGYVLTSTPSGVRSWINPAAFAGVANVSLYSGVANVALLANQANTVLSLSNFSTANLTEGINLYFTNARVVSALTAGDNIIIEANGRISANVASITSSITNSTIQGNLKITGTLTANSIVINGNEVFNGEQGANLFVTRITANIWNGLYTANVIESPANLYFTNSRVVSALIAGQNITIEANGRISANIASSIANIQSQISNLTTDQIPEGSTNKYFTNARVVSALIAGQNIIIESNGRISANITGITSAIANSTIQGNLRLTGSLTANSIIINGNEVFNGEQGANLFVTKITANIWSGLYTANVIESPTNLYFTNARAIAAVSGANLTLSNLTILKDLILQSNTIFFGNTDRANLLYNPTTDSFAFNKNFQVAGNLTIGGGIGGNITGVENLFTNNMAANALVANILILGTGSGGNITGAENISTNNLFANVITANTFIFPSNLKITGAITANSIIINGNEVFNGEAGANLTVTRIVTDSIIANTWNRLYTANVIETSGNLYFTNSRVVSALVAGQNIIIEANGRISANITTTVSNLQSQINSLTTDQITEGTNNLYYTNSRVRSAISGGTGVTVNSSTGQISIGQDVSTTANVTFYNLSVTNNLIVYGGVEKFLANNLVVSDNMIYLNNGSINSNPDLGIAFNYNDGVYHHAGFFRDHSDGSFKVFDNYSPEPDANIFINTAHASFRLANLQATNYIGNVTGFVTGQVSSLDNLNTSALKEGANLYFTNARVVQAVTPLLTTSNVTEGTNLYFTNSRVLVGITTGVVVGNINVTGSISANSIIINGNEVFNGEAGANLTVTKIIANTITANSWNGLYTANVVETTNLYFTNARVVSALIAGQNIIIEPNGRISANVTTSIANLQAQISNLTTDLVPEGSTNLYFTNSRVLVGITTGTVPGNINVTGSISANSIIINGNEVFNGEAGANLTVTRITTDTITANVWNRLYTANVIETSGNLYFTNARVINALVNSNVQVQNLYANSTIYANTIVLQNINVTSNIISGSVSTGTTTSNVIVADSITSNTLTVTANIVSFNNLIANGLIIRNITVTDQVLTGNVTVTATTSNTILADTITANVWNRLYTANVIETAGNLYFTNSRVVSALSAGQNIILASNGQISANLVSISAGENVTLEANGRLSVTLIPVTSINDSSRFVSTGNVTYNLITSISDPRNIMVIVEGMVQMPYVDYNTNGSYLTFSEAPYLGSNIEVRFFGVDTINSSRAIAASVDTFIGDGTNVSYTLSTVPPNKNFVSIIIDGVYQHSDVFTLNTKTITFPEAPALGSNIDIRVIGGTAGSTYNTRTFTGNGISTTFALSDGFTRDTILVFENGVAQVPLVDYDIVNNNLVFTTAPASNVTVQVREMGISGISAANVVAAIRGADQIVGNLIPTTDINKNLGSSIRRFNKLYLEANGLVVGDATLSTSQGSLSITTANTTTQFATAASVSAKAFGLSLIFGG